MSSGKKGPKTNLSLRASIHACFNRPDRCGSKTARVPRSQVPKYTKQCAATPSFPCLLASVLPCLSLYRAAAATSFSIGAPIKFPHSVHEPS